MDVHSVRGVACVLLFLFSIIQTHTHKASSMQRSAYFKKKMQFCKLPKIVGYSTQKEYYLFADTKKV